MPEANDAKGRVLIVDDDLNSLGTLSELLTAEGYEVRGAADGATALMLVDNAHPDVVLLDVRMPGMDGYEICRRITADERWRSIPILFLSGLEELKDKIEGFKAGGVDFIVKPFEEHEVLARVEVHVELSTLRRNLEQRVAERTAEIERLRGQLEAENIYLREQVEVQHPHEDIVGQSEAIRCMLRDAEKVASSDSTVLLLGETGTGKELVAHAIHRLSQRSSKPLVTVNCAALPPTLIESELFGREKGAYTGALSRQAGRFEIADGSTIFLDEIGDLSHELQVKLLRVLETGEIERLGSSKTLTVDVRVIAATNRNLQTAVEEGRFREDLYYRLNVFPITVPPLRDRRDDIPLLVWAFVREFAASQGMTIDTVPERAMESLQDYPWPGNVRELRNVIERAVILSDGPILRASPPDVPAASVATASTMEEIQRNHILQIMEQTGWRVRGAGGAAEILDMKPSTLENRMKKLGIEKPKKP